MATPRRKHRSPVASVATVPDAAMMSDDPATTWKRPRFVRKGKKIQIALTITEALLE